MLQDAREVQDAIRRMADKAPANETLDAITAGLNQAGVKAVVPMVAEAKPWWQSRAVIGGIIAGIGVPLAGVFGYAVTDADADQLTMLIMGLTSTVGGILAVWGRIKATKVVK